MSYITYSADQLNRIAHMLYSLSTIERENVEEAETEYSAISLGDGISLYGHDGAEVGVAFHDGESWVFAVNAETVKGRK